MSLIPKVVIDKPRKNNFDLSFINRFSAACGLLYPVQVKQAFPGDEFSIETSMLIKTLPLLGPLMGSFKVQVDHFFVPIRLYNRQLHNDMLNFKPENVYLPQIRVRSYDGGEFKGIHETSLLHFLGLPRRLFDRIRTGGNINDGWYRDFNAVPMLGYFDIFKNYYANVQEDTFPQMLRWLNDDDLVEQPLQAIDDLRSYILKQSHGRPFIIDDDSDYDDDGEFVEGMISPYRPSGSWYENGQLVARTYLPDLFTAWINTESYEAINEQAAVTAEVVNGVASFNVDQFRFANKLNQMLQKTLVSGGRYSDWQEVQYGSKLKTINEIPTFIGSVSTELTFDDVVQTSADVPGQPLGSLAGRGHAYMENRRSRYYVPENGFIMSMFSIIPRVDYFQGVKHYMRLKTMADIHVPELDQIGFQDMLADNMNAGISTYLVSQASMTNPWAERLLTTGKQPAWVELMSSVNEVHGDFAIGAGGLDDDRVGLIHMTLARRFDFVSENFNKPYSAYINPRLFNQNFADASLGARNFWCQIKFNTRVKRAMSKRVMPRL